MVIWDHRSTDRVERTLPAVENEPLSEETIQFCIRCGTAVEEQATFGRLRPVCPSCGWVYFADPKVAAAVLVERDGQVLLTRRVNDPQRGLWSLPAGFIDAGEDPAQAARRECLEETGLKVKITSLLDVIAGREHTRGADIIIVYRAEVVSGSIQAGDDADKVEFFARDQLPPLAFYATRKVLGVE
jgi:8-oxo-dGTP diphosphatase